MSQFEMPHADPYSPHHGEPVRTSALAVWALVCSLVFCCPVTTVLGVVLGLAALVATSGGARKGKGLAWAAILIGLVLSVGWGFAGVFGGKWVGRVLELMYTRAPDAVMAGAGGNYAAFRAEFHGAGATTTDEQAKAFFDELTRRFGALQSVRFDEATPQPQGGPTMPVPYIFTFENETRSGHITLIFADQVTGEWPNKILSITVDGGAEGDVTFPP